MENRIQINGVWYVAEQDPKPEFKTVNWMIARLQELAEEGYGECEMTLAMDYGKDYDTIASVEPMVDWNDGEVTRVHIS